MALPKQVADAAAEADRLIREATAPAAAEDAPPAPQSTDTGVPPEYVEAIEARPPRPAQIDGEVVSKAEYDALFRQFRTLQGMHKPLLDAREELTQANARLQSDNRDLAARLDELERRLAARTAPAASGLTPEEIAEYQPEFLDVVGRKAREVVGAELNEAKELAASLQRTVQELAQRNKQLEDTVRGVATESAEQKQQAFYSQLSALVPNLEAWNNDLEFIEWLQSENPLTGRPLKADFDSAVQAWAAERVARYFFAWPGAAKYTNPAQQQQPARRTLADQATPETRRGEAPPPTSRGEGRMWHPSEIKRFYDDKVAGRAKGPEAARIEADIFKAQAEGRVIPA
jgi:hypothetical protein